MLLCNPSLAAEIDWRDGIAVFTLSYFIRGDERRRRRMQQPAKKKEVRGDRNTERDGLMPIRGMELREHANQDRFILDGTRFEMSPAPASYQKL